MKPIIAITTGDTNGIGYEVIIKALLEAHMFELFKPVIYGNAVVAKHHIQTLGDYWRNINWNIIDTPEQAKDSRLNLIVSYPDNTEVTLGVPSEAANQAAKASLDRACKDLKEGKVDALVTAPLNKEALHGGHTEYLEKMFNGANGGSLMMLCSEGLRVALVCNHVSIADIPAQNPHAGDAGLLGKEEQEIIAPAIQKANEQGLWAFGPYAADGFFGSGHFKHFDAVLAMYHDQGLIPFKTLDMSGVNYTAGLPPST